LLEDGNVFLICICSDLFVNLFFQKLSEDRRVDKNVRKTRKLTYQKSLRRVRKFAHLFIISVNLFCFMVNQPE